MLLRYVTFLMVKWTVMLTVLLFWNDNAKIMSPELKKPFFDLGKTKNKKQNKTNKQELVYQFSTLKIIYVDEKMFLQIILVCKKMQWR